MPDANVFNAQFEYDDAPDGYRCGEAPVGKTAGGHDLTVRLYELPAAQSLCPYHYEYEEEWVLVLEGQLVVRSPDGEAPVPRGALVCFPSGPRGAHKLTNPGPGTARALMWSSAREPAMAVYPDSDKIGVWPPNRDDRLMVRRADAQVDYWEGEA